MTPPDAAGMADLIVKLGLVEEYTVREALFELGSAKGPPDDLIALLQRKSLITPLQGSKLMKGDRDGYFLGGYRVLYKIASGTFGRVYRGDDPGSGRTVAIKVLRNKWTQEKQKVDQFMREGRVGLTLQHPNIVSILAVSQDAKTGQYFIVMEFVEGGNLRDIMQIRKRIEIDESLRIMEECTAGMAFAYTRGLTHRDIKASNILLSTDKTAKLVDFGLAEMSSVTQTAGNMVIGRMDEKDEELAIDRTIDYAGLEKATGVSKGDVRSDIYFLGHVLYEMIAGEPLMPVTKDRQARGQRRRYEEVERTLERGAADLDLPTPVYKLIAKAVAFEPFQRFQTPAQFHEQIKAVRAELKGETAADETHRADGPLTVYVVEGNQKLQDVFRDKLKKMGFRVLMSSDATQALKRYQAAPYHAILIDAGTAGADGVTAFEKVLVEAGNTRLDLAGVLILNEDQADQAAKFDGSAGGRAFVRPVTMKQLHDALQEMVPELTAAAE